MTSAPPIPNVDVEVLRCEIQNEYREVATHPDKGFHLHTGRKLAKILEYDDALLDAELAAVVERAGFENFEITWSKEVFDGAPQSSS